MGKVIRKKIQGIGWKARISLVLLFTFMSSVFMYQGWYKPLPVQAAIAGQAAWSSLYAAVAYPSGNLTTQMTVNAGTNRLLVVAIASTRTAVGSQTVSNVTWNGKPLTLAAGDDAITDNWSHTYLYYLKDADMPAVSTTAPVTVTISGGTSYRNFVYARVYNGVDQTTPFTDTQNYNSATANSAVGPFSPTLAIDANDQAIEIVNLSRSTTGTTARTVSTWATGWTTAGVAPASIITSGPTATMYIRDRAVPTSATTDGSQHTASSTSTWDSMTAMSIKVAGAAPPSAGTVQLAAATNSVSESVAGGTLTLTVTRTGGSAGSGSVYYSTTANTATAGSDFTATSGTLNWADGDAASKSIVIPIINDSYDEQDETFTLTLSSPSNVTLGSTSATTVTIVDDDATPTVQFQSAASSGNEGTSPAAINVTLSAASGRDVMVNYATANVTATAGSDYTTTGGTLTIPALSTSATINVPILTDAVTDPNETFTITLSAPVNATLGATTLHTRTITETAASTLTCSGCHGYTATFDDGATRNDAGKFPGTHKQHVIGSAMACSACHVQPAANNHANGTINMSSAMYGKGSSWAATNTPSAFLSCSNTNCHGTTSPAWGNNSASTIDTCTKCHGTKSASPATDLQKAPSSPATAAHAAHLAATGGKPVICAECHQNVDTTGAAGHMDGVKTIQYNGPVGTANTTPSGSYPANCATTWCHGGNTGSLPQNRPNARTAPVWGTSFGATSVLGDALGTASTNTGSGRCAQCHGYPPPTSSHAGTNLDGSGGKKSCFSCHENLTTAGIFTVPSMHINGSIEGGDCIGCHTGFAKDSASTKPRDAVGRAFTDGKSHHIQGVAVTKDKCYACHMEADASGNTTSYHEMKQTGTVDLVVWSGNTRGAAFVKYTSNGSTSHRRDEVGKINNHCLGCHTGGTFGTEPTNPFGDGKQPSEYAWDAKSIAEKYSQTGTTKWSQYSTANTNKKKHLNKAYSAHGNTANNQMGWNTTNGVDGDITDITSNVNVVCFDCHNSHGSSVAGKTVSYTTMSSAKYNGGIFKNTTSSVGGYTATYKSKAGGDPTNKNVYQPGAGLCFDCHNNRSAAAAKTPWGYGTTALGGTFGATAPLYGYWDTPYFGNYTFASTKRNTYKAGAANAMTANKGGHYGASSTLTSPPDTAHQIGGICTPCHDPHGVSPNTTATGINGAQQYAVPLLKGTWVTSPYKEDMAPVNATRPRGGGSKQTVMNYGSDVLYNIDQNTFRKNRASTTTVQINAGANIAFNLLSTSANRLQTVADTDFAGLCTKCHTKANLTDTAQASTVNWKTRNRIHQTVEGWAATSGTGGNVNNKVHAYTCSKCHAPHNSRLPRLMVTNCLDMKHRGKVTSGGSVSSVAAGGTTAANTGNLHSSVNSTGKGAGRFPSGGGRYTGTRSITSSSGARNPGPWMFGAVQSGSQAGSYTTNCHNTATSGGTTYTPANQQWNSKTIW